MNDNKTNDQAITDVTAYAQNGHVSSVLLYLILSGQESKIISLPTDISVMEYEQYKALVGKLPPEIYGTENRVGSFRRGVRNGNI